MKHYDNEYIITMLKDYLLDYSMAVLGYEEVCNSYTNLPFDNDTLISRIEFIRELIEFFEEEKRN